MKRSSAAVSRRFSFDHECEEAPGLTLIDELNNSRSELRLA